MYSYYIPNTTAGSTHRKKPLSLSIWLARRAGVGLTWRYLHLGHGDTNDLTTHTYHTSYPHSCFHSLSQCLLHGGTKGLTADTSTSALRLRDMPVTFLLTSDSSQRPLSTQHTKTHSISGIRARDPINKVGANPCLRRRGHRVWNFSNNRSIYIRVIGIKFGFMSILGVPMHRMLVEVLRAR